MTLATLLSTLALLLLWRLSRRIDALSRALAVERAERERLALRLAAAGDTSPQAPPAQETPAEEAPALAPEPLDAASPPPTSTPVVPAPRGAEARAPKPDLENRLGARWTIWVGGLALALGGVFLVRYSIEQGLLGPGPRIALGALFSAALLWAGERLRRNERRVGLAPDARATIPGVLTAAGTVSAFGTVYAAHALYGFIGPGAAFLLLALVSLATLAGALLHGPGLGAAGLLGALVTPMLVTAENPEAASLFIYLAFVVAAAMALARIRGWTWMAVSAQAGAFLWAALYLLGLGDAEPLLIGLFALVLAALAYAPEILLGESARTPPLRVLPLLAPAHALLILSAVQVGEQGTGVLVVAGAFCALLLGAAIRAARHESLAPAAAVTALLVLLSWNLPDSPGEFGDLLAGSRALAVAEAARLVRTAWLLAALFALAGLSGAWRGRSAAFLAGAGAIAPAALQAAAYVQTSGFEPSGPYAVVALAAAAGLALLAERSLRSPPARQPEAVTALIAAGAAIFLCLGLTYVLDQGWLTVSFALVALALAWIEGHRGLRAMRALAVGAAALTAARLVAYPLVVADPAASSLPWIIALGYGVPAAAFALGSVLLRRRGDDLAVAAFEGLAIAFAALLGVLEIRTLLNAGDPFAPELSLAEVGLQISVGLAFSMGLARLGMGRSGPVLALASRLFCVVSLFAVAVGLGVSENPLLVPNEVGSGWANVLLVAYALPMLMTGLLAMILRRRGEDPLATAASAVSVLLGFAWLTLQVRHHFQGSVLVWERPTSELELYVYSAVWLAFAVALLAAGVLTGRRALRLASGLLLAVVALKVFLVDMASLEGVLRALSFIGLGAILIGIGLVYQRVLARS